MPKRLREIIANNKRVFWACFAFSLFGGAVMTLKEPLQVHRTLRALWSPQFSTQVFFTPGSNPNEDSYSSFYTIVQAATSAMGFVFVFCCFLTVSFALTLYLCRIAPQGAAPETAETSGGGGVNITN